MPLPLNRSPCSGPSTAVQVWPHLFLQYLWRTLSWYWWISCSMKVCCLIPVLAELAHSIFDRHIFCWEGMQVLNDLKALRINWVAKNLADIIQQKHFSAKGNIHLVVSNTQIGVRLEIPQLYYSWVIALLDESFWQTCSSRYHHSLPLKYHFKWLFLWQKFDPTFPIRAIEICKGAKWTVNVTHWLCKTLGKCVV